jgi:hypothetical protein
MLKRTINPPDNDMKGLFSPPGFHRCVLSKTYITLLHLMLKPSLRMGFQADSASKDKTGSDQNGKRKYGQRPA